MLILKLLLLPHFTALVFCALWNMNIYVQYEKRGLPGHIEYLTYSSTMWLPTENAQEVLSNVESWSDGRFKPTRIKDRNTIKITTQEITDNADDAVRKVKDLKYLINQNIGASSGLSKSEVRP